MKKISEIIINNNASISIFSLLSAILNLFSIPILIGLIGTTDYGLYLYHKLFTYIGICPLFCFGLPLMLNKFVSSNSTTNNELDSIYLMIFSISLVFILGFFITLNYVFFEDFFNNIIQVPEDKKLEFNFAFFLTILSLPFQLVFIILNSYFEGKNAYLFVKGSEFIKSLIFFICALVLGLLGYTFYEFILISLLIFFIFLFLFFYYFYKDFIKHKVNINVSNIYSSLKPKIYFLKKMTIQSVISSISNNIERFFIILFLNPNLMSLYEILIKLPKLIKNFFSLSNKGTFTAISSYLFINSNNSLTKIFLFMSYLNFLIAISVTIPCAYFAKEILNIWLGNNFLFLSNQLTLLLILNLIMPVFTISGQIALIKSYKLNLLNFLSFTIIIIKLLILYFARNMDLWAVIYCEIANLLTWILLFSVMKYIKVNIINFIKEIFKIILSSLIILFVLSFIDLTSIYLLFICLPLSSLGIILLYLYLADDDLRNICKKAIGYMTAKFFKSGILKN